MQLEYGDERKIVAADDVVIGSEPAATIRLAGASVAPRHALVRRSGDGVVVIQVGGSEPVEVNGAAVGRDPTPLLHGDRVGISGHVITVVDPRQGAATQQLGAAGTPPAPEPASGPARPRERPSGRLVSLSDGREYRVNVAPFVFGREATSAVVITSPDASRQHAEIVNRPDGDVLVDLSSNGTYVNGDRVGDRHFLKALDVIRIGAEEFRYYPAPNMPAEPAAGAEFRLGDTLVGLPKLSVPPVPKSPARATELASLLIKKGDMRGERIAVRAPVVNIGRAEYNDVRLPDNSVSASHAKLQLREGVWILADAGSTNGTSVDDIDVTEETPLSPGSVIGIGEVRLLFEPRDEKAVRQAGTQVLSAPPARLVEPEGADGPSLGPWGWAVGLVVILAAVLVALTVLF